MGTRSQALLLLLCSIAILGSTSTAQTMGTTKRTAVRVVKEPFAGSSSSTSTVIKRSASTRSSATTAASTTTDPLLGAVFDPGNSAEEESDAMIAAGPKYLMAVSGSLGYRILD